MHRTGHQDNQDHQIKNPSLNHQQQQQCIQIHSLCYFFIYGCDSNELKYIIRKLKFVNNQQQQIKTISSPKDNIYK